MDIIIHSVRADVVSSLSRLTSRQQQLFIPYIELSSHFNTRPTPRCLLTLTAGAPWSSVRGRGTSLWMASSMGNGGEAWGGRRAQFNSLCLISDWSRGLGATHSPWSAGASQAHYLAGNALSGILSLIPKQFSPLEHNMCGQVLGLEITLSLQSQVTSPASGPGRGEPSEVTSTQR